MPDDEYVRDPTTGQEYTVRRGNETVIGDVEVTGRLTNNGAAVGGGGSVTLETATPAEGDGVETEFVFVGVPFDVKRNGVSYDPSEFSVLGTTVTITVPPISGKITALTQ